VQAALSQAFPQCSDLSSDPSRGIQAFTPHLSLGQWRTRAEVEAAERQVAASWQPLSFEAGGVVLLSRQGFADPFSFHYFVPFGGRPPVAFRPPLPYIATVGGGGDEVAASTGTSGGSQPTSDLRQRLAGIGAATPDGSVWNFAFGANMSPRKLNGARGLHPLESLPARLPGWRLTFTHRGGMGNIVRQVAGASPGPAGDGKEERACVHGVLHRLSPSDYGRLADMEHEYRWAVAVVQCVCGVQLPWACWLLKTLCTPVQLPGHHLLALDSPLALLGSHLFHPPCSHPSCSGPWRCRCCHTAAPPP
jgi:hypothetical protein